MGKNQVYSWRLTTETKDSLEREAKRRGRTIADVLDTLTAKWLASRGTDAEAEEEARVRAAALRCVGRIRGTNPARAEQARELVRQRLLRRAVARPRRGRAS